MSEARLYVEIAIWSQVVSSFVFMGVLVFAWFRWLMPVFLAAQARSNAQIAQAEQHRDEVKNALETLRREIDSARHDAELISQRTAAHAEHEREAVLGEATAAGERVVQNAQGELDRARAVARARLRDEVLARALRVAREDAAQRVGAPLDARLVERFVGSLEGGVRG